MNVREREGQSVAWLTTAETAKLVRKQLKRLWPGVKFSVRSSNYSMGSSISVRWEDGPTEPEVRQATERYGGATFDAMIDLKEYKGPIAPERELLADIRETFGTSFQQVRMGADWVQCQRSISEETAAKITAEVEALGLPITEDRYQQTDIYREVAIDRQTGELFICSGMTYAEQPSSLGDIIHRAGYVRSL